jgi:hypothetical protein
MIKVENKDQLRNFLRGNWLSDTDSRPLFGRMLYLIGLDTLDQILGEKVNDWIRFYVPVYFESFPNGVKVSFKKWRDNLQSDEVYALPYSSLNKIYIERQPIIDKLKLKWLNENEENTDFDKMLCEYSTRNCNLGPRSSEVTSIYGKGYLQHISPSFLIIFDIILSGKSLALICQSPPESQEKNEKHLNEIITYFHRLKIPIEEINDLPISKISSQNEIINSLERLASLFEKGLLTKEEFDLQKQKLL